MIENRNVISNISKSLKINLYKIFIATNEISRSLYIEKEDIYKTIKRADNTVSIV